MMRLALGLAACALIPASTASGQCLDLEPLLGSSSQSSRISVTAMVDHDGDPQTPAKFYVAGSIRDWGDTRIDLIGEWDGHRFVRGPSGFAKASVISSAAAWDPDGIGPLNECLVICGKLQPDGQTTSRPMVAMWTGSAWQELPLTGLSNVLSVDGLVVWDSDGSGPQAPRLIALGTFSTSGGSANAAWWNGSLWRPLTTSTSAFATAPTIGCVHDPDGPGPLLPRLYVSGRGGSSVVQFDGATRTVLGSLNPNCCGMVSVDLDGSGPNPPSLYVASTSGWIARWTGSTWLYVGETDLTTYAGSKRISALSSWDADGSGPLPPVLVVGGYFQLGSGNVDTHIATWNGLTWKGYGKTIDLGVNTVSVFDPDGSGPDVPQLFCFSDSNALPSVRWGGAAWIPAPGYQLPGLGSGMETDIVKSLLAFPDQAALQPASILATGRFSQVGTFAVPTTMQDSFGVAQYSGGVWTPLGGGFNDYVNTAVRWDPDGDGPASPQVVVGGAFFRVENRTNLGVCRWNGSSWAQMGSGLVQGGTPSVFSLSTWDFDGDGPEPASLIACGAFTASGTQKLNSVARWDGTAWQPIGTGLATAVFGFSRFDPDGDGPQPDQLLALGRFRGLGGIPSDRSVECVARWDGTSWRALSDGTPATFGKPPLALAAEVYSAVYWDADGDGPLPQRLVIAGSFSSINGDTSIAGIAMWNGAAWESLGLPVLFSVRTLSVIDPDGDGPQKPVLVAAGYLNAVGKNVAVYDGATWTYPDKLIVNRDNTFTQYSMINSALQWDPDGTGPERAALLLGGEFDSVGDANHGYITGMQFGVPGVVVSPQSTQLNVSATASFQAESSSRNSNPAIHWYRDGAILSDGVDTSGTRVVGSATLSLRLENLHVADSGVYVCQVDDGCGAGRSDGAALQVICRADVNADGFLTFEDFDEFVAAFEAGAASADFDGDSQLTYDDFDAFVLALEQGC